MLVLDPIPFADTEKTPEGQARMFQPIAVTLITGETDAVLVDPPMTTEQTEATIARLEQRIADLERQLLAGTSQSPPRSSAPPSTTTRARKR